MDLYVSTQGNDGWSGQLPEPNATRTDGPLATLAGARNRVRQLIQPQSFARTSLKSTAEGYRGAITVRIRGGRYPVTEPVLFEAQDSAPVTYTAYPGEKPIIDGGVRITGWRVEQVNGRACWVAELPEVAADRWNFRQLYVNGERRPRSRLPKTGFYWMESVPGLTLPAAWGVKHCDAFVCAPGDIQPWKNLTDVEVVALHWWIEERMPIASFDPEKRLVKLGRGSCSPLVDDRNQKYAKYYVENAIEALSEPGEWYLDRPTGRLVYLPKPGETPENTEVFAPKTLQLLQIVGDPENNQFVEFLRFEGLTFQHTDWRHSGEEPPTVPPVPPAKETPKKRRWHDRGNLAAAPQAACDVPGVISLEGARRCAFEDCTIRNVGWYGVELADGSSGNSVIGCHLYDLGAGGVKLNGSDAQGPVARRTGYNSIIDNNLQAGGRVFHSAVGILSMHSFGNVFAHNHIHDFFYTGISCGWVWGYTDSVSHSNVIEKNHIHLIGQGLLSDMGGVYLLGVAPGTVVRGNLIHDIQKANYGGWCLYTDEGSSHVVLEDNVCYDTNSEIFHQHYGRENTVRNNILAFGGETQFAYSRVEPHVGLTFERNIVISDGRPMTLRDYGPGQRRIFSDLNLFWDVSGKPPCQNSPGGRRPDLSMAEWQALGYDQHSVVADPLCADMKKRDFTLAKDSPAFKLGFKPIDLSDVGPRPKDKRGT
jgi:hypothetical protein